MANAAGDPCQSLGGIDKDAGKEAELGMVSGE